MLFPQSLGNQGAISHSWFWCNTCPLCPTAPSCLCIRNHELSVVSSVLLSPDLHFGLKNAAFCICLLYKCPTQFHKANTDRTNQHIDSIWEWRLSAAVMFIPWPFSVKHLPSTTSVLVTHWGSMMGSPLKTMFVFYQLVHAPNSGIGNFRHSVLSQGDLQFQLSVSSTGNFNHIEWNYDVMFWMTATCHTHMKLSVVYLDENVSGLANSLSEMS